MCGEFGYSFKISVEISWKGLAGLEGVSTTARRGDVWVVYLETRTFNAFDIIYRRALQIFRAKWIDEDL